MLTKDEKAILIEAAIFELDKAQVEKLESKNTTGNKAAIYGTVAQNMVDTRNYEIERQRLVKLRDDTLGVSQSVTDFLNSKPQFASKLDVQEGRAEIDDSLEPLGGKAI